MNVNDKPFSSSPLLVTIIPAGASVSYAIIRGGIQAGGIYKFEILTADSFGNPLSSSTYRLYGPKDYNVQVQYLGNSRFNSTSGTVADKKGNALCIVFLICFSELNTCYDQMGPTMSSYQQMVHRLQQ